VQVLSHLQRCADGATTFSSTCSRVAEQGASPFLPAAVCRWCHHLLFNMQQCGRAGCKSLSTCSGVPMVPPLIFNTAPSQRRCDTARGPEVSISGSRLPPADQWHLLRACLCEPEPGGGVRSAPPASPPLCSPCCLNAALAAYMRPLPPSCGPRRLHAALAAFMRPSPPSCGPRRLHAVLPPHLHILALAQWFSRGRFSRPSSQDVGRSFSPACTFVKMQTGGGLLWRIYSR
jgi:hypothetical protein